MEPVVLIPPAMKATIHSQSGKVSKSLIVAASMILFAALAIVIAWPIFVQSRRPCGNACVMNLRAIEGAKATWALENKKLPTDTPTDDDLFGATLYIFEKPKCPQGGKYALGMIREKPKCSVAEHNY